MRYWVFFYNFQTLTQQGSGSMHLSSEGTDHISITEVGKRIKKDLEEKYSIQDVKVTILSFNELKEEDYESSK